MMRSDTSLSPTRPLPLSPWLPDTSLSPTRPLPLSPWHPDSCAACGCRCGGGAAATGRMTMKRKLDFSDDPDVPSTPDLQVLHLAARPQDVVARVEAEDECLALQEALSRQNQLIQELYRDLEEERNASSSSASEAMSMILRIQREKAEVQMEFRQFRQFAEDRMAHDQQEMLALEDVCFRRDQTIQALLCQVQAYKHRLMSYGVDPDADPTADDDASSPRVLSGGRRGGRVEDHDNTAKSFGSVCDDYYPSLKCATPEAEAYDDLVVKYAAGDTPRSPESSTREHLQHIEQRMMWHMERHATTATSTGGSIHHLSVLENEVVVGNPPLLSRLDRRVSCDSSSSFVTREVIQEVSVNENHHHEDPPPVTRHRISQVDEDKMSDRVFIIEAIDEIAAPVPVGLHEDYPTSPGSVTNREAGSELTDIKKLYMRLQSLEADRENLKQAIVSMRTDRAQMVLLKELAENISKGVVLPPPVLPPPRPLTKKPSLLGAFSFFSAIKWIISLQWITSVAFWKKKTKHCKYMLRLTNGKVGLLLVLDKTLFTKQWRCLTRPIS